MGDTENPTPRNSDDNLAGLRGDETSYAEQNIIAPIVDDSLAQLAENGADAGDITQVTSMLAARGVTITPQIEALIRRKIEEAEIKKGTTNKEAEAAKSPDGKGTGGLEDELAGIRGNFAAESAGMAAEAPPPPAKGAGQGMDMSYFSRMSDPNKKK